MVKALCEYTEAELRQELSGRAGEIGLHRILDRQKVSDLIGIAPPHAAPLKLDLGCGKNKKAGFLGVDALKFEGVDIVTDLGAHAWPWADASVEEVHASHFVEHLGPKERMHFANELFRVLKPGGKATIITPHWNSPRAYGDLTHVFPPVSEWWYLYLSKAWREVNAPHNTDYTCDFPQPVVGYSPNPALCAGRNPEYVQQMVTTARGGADDMSATLTKPSSP